MKFYLGTHQPSWLARDLGIPLLVSHRRLADRRSLPRATHRWALDSGGFTELSLHGRWRTDPATYVPGAASVICVAINYHVPLASVPAEEKAHHGKIAWRRALMSS